MSRVGLIADIHGNLLALETALAELERDGIERLVCLGDVAALGPFPRECVARLRELGCPTVLGNTDEWLLAGVPGEATAARMPIIELTGWGSAQLTDDDRAWLVGLPMTVDLPLDAGRRLLGYHGSPRSHEDVIAATTPDDELAALLDGYAAEIMVGGHTHIPLVRRFGAGHLVNPGSVGLPGTGPGTPGLPVNRDVSWAEYAVVSADAGRLSIELRRVPLDMQRLLREARDSGMPHFGWWATLYAGDQGHPPSGAAV